MTYEQFKQDISDFILACPNPRIWDKSKWEWNTSRKGFYFFRVEDTVWEMSILISLSPSGVWTFKQDLTANSPDVWIVGKGQSLAESYKDWLSKQ